MVKEATEFTMDCRFLNDPVKLLAHFTSFKQLNYFQGEKTGFSHCKLYNRYFEDPNSFEYCVNISTQCERIFHSRMLFRRRLTRLILFLSVKLRLENKIIIELIRRFYLS